MAKEAYYFSHDSNARHDPKITAMRGIYGAEGYGWYWMFIEMMRDSDGYKLDMQGKYTFNAYAMQLHGDCKRIEEFVHDCINEFNLFESDGVSFWSDSLMRRMQLREQKSKARSKAAKARWDKERQASSDSADDASDMQMHSNSNANGMQGKESKVKESKGNKNKDKKHIVDSNECDSAFEQFWNLYPSKTGKKPALTKWTTMWKKKPIDIETVLKGTKRYIEYVQWRRKNGFADLQYKNGSTFVSQECWNDEYQIGGAGSEESQAIVRPRGVQTTGYEAENEFAFLDKPGRS